MALKAIKIGIYKHYKGKTYRVLTEAQHTESEDWMTVYKDERGKVWVRPSDMFMGQVELESGELVERFKFIG